MENNILFKLFESIFYFSISGLFCNLLYVYLFKGLKEVKLIVRNNRVRL